MYSIYVYITSHPVPPSRPSAVYPVFPMFAPCTVTDTAPAAPPFTSSITLTPAASVDHPSVKLPDRTPAVTTARLDPITPSPTLHLTDVSDTQSVP